MPINATENNNAVLILIDPPHNVPIQLNIFTPVGIAIAIVETLNAAFAAGPNPTVNIWWLHTNQPKNPIAIPENTIKEYP